MTHKKRYVQLSTILFSAKMQIFMRYDGLSVGDKGVTCQKWFPIWGEAQKPCQQYECMCTNAPVLCRLRVLQKCKDRTKLMCLNYFVFSKLPSLSVDTRITIDNQWFQCTYCSKFLFEYKETIMHLHDGLHTCISSILPYLY